MILYSTKNGTLPTIIDGRATIMLSRSMQNTTTTQQRLNGAR